MSEKQLSYICSHQIRLVCIKSRENIIYVNNASFLLRRYNLDIQETIKCNKLLNTCTHNELWEIVGYCW